MDNEKVILEKLEAIEEKVTREIHGGNGKGLWQEIRDIKRELEKLKNYITSIIGDVEEHQTRHSTKKEVEKDRRARIGMWVAIIGLALSFAGQAMLLVRVLAVLNVIR